MMFVRRLAAMPRHEKMPLLVPTITHMTIWTGAMRLGVAIDASLDSKTGRPMHPGSFVEVAECHCTCP